MLTVKHLLKRCYIAVVIFFLAVNAQFVQNNECFCMVKEMITDCPCANYSIDVFNNERVFPLLKALLQRDFFVFYKVNMERPCPLWNENRMCSSQECGIGYCDDEVPEAFRSQTANKLVNNAENKHLEPCDSSNQFDPLDRSLSDDDRDQLRKMDFFEEQDDTKYCDVDDEFSSDIHYVNLLKNPERYTGYKGDSALKVWRCIYQENCFKPDPKFDKNFLLQPTSNGMCLEKRVFYRLISGFHSSITITIAANNFEPAPGLFGEGTWYRNIDMFSGRFGTKWSKDGPDRLKNVYFVYMLELRAIVKLLPYLENELFYTGNEKEDLETRNSVEQITKVLKDYPDQFDETQLFTGVDSHARWLREEFRQHFLNISRIMDCVDCDKCRLWGKLQTHGMGTALKILFSDLPALSNVKGVSNVDRILNKTNKSFSPPFQLTRNDVVALFQSFGRYAANIFEVNEFRRELFMAAASTVNLKQSQRQKNR